jgi:hypothetical protein
MSCAACGGGSECAVITSGSAARCEMGTYLRPLWDAALQRESLYVSEHFPLHYTGYGVEDMSCHCRHMFDAHATLTQGNCCCCVFAAG